MKRLFLLVLIITTLPIMMFAQTLSSHSGTVKTSYNFWFYQPPQNDNATNKEHPDSLYQKKPLVVFLHGASLCGKHLSKVLKYGTMDAIMMGLKLDAYVLTPQNPGGSWNPDKIDKLVDWALEHYPADSTRIYVLGMSLGGYGTIDYTACYPNRVAAAMALCGGGTKTAQFKNLNQVPLAILHGTADRSVSWKASQAVVDAMTNAGETNRLLYYKLPGKNHGALARYFYLPDTYNWLFSHQLTDSLRPVCQDYSFDASVIENVYRKLDKNNAVKVEMIKGEVNEAIAEAGPTETEEKTEKVEKKKETTKNPNAGSNGGVHVVKKGDTLSSIARKHHTTVNKLCQLNGIKRESTLRLGQKIRY